MTKKTLTIKPRAKQVVVRPDDEPTRESEHGILTPTNVEQEKKAIGTIVSVGKGIDDLKKGDRVIYGAYAGESIKLRESTKEVDYKILFDEDVLALIEE